VLSPLAQLAHVGDMASRFLFVIPCQMQVFAEFQPGDETPNEHKEQKQDYGKEGEWEHDGSVRSKIPNRASMSFRRSDPTKSARQFAVGDLSSTVQNGCRQLTQVRKKTPTKIQT
jgi:hypothetical protein